MEMKRNETKWNGVEWNEIGIGIKSCEMESSTTEKEQFKWNELERTEVT